MLPRLPWFLASPSASWNRFSLDCGDETSKSVRMEHLSINVQLSRTPTVRAQPLQGSVTEMESSWTCPSTLKPRRPRTKNARSSYEEETGRFSQSRKSCTTRRLSLTLSKVRSHQFSKSHMTRLNAAHVTPLKFFQLRKWSLFRTLLRSAPTPMIKCLTKSQRQTPWMTWPQSNHERCTLISQQMIVLTWWLDVPRLFSHLLTAALCP